MFFCLLKDGVLSLSFLKTTSSLCFFVFVFIQKNFQDGPLLCFWAKSVCFRLLWPALHILVHGEVVNNVTIVVTITMITTNCHVTTNILTT